MTKKPLIDETAKIAEGCLVKKSNVGEHAIIGKDGVIIQSQVGPYCEIGQRNLMRKSSIGIMTYTGADTSITWAEVGKYCCISRLVDIGGNQHNYKAISMMPDYRFKNCMGGAIAIHPDEDVITVGNDVWIGQGASIVRKPNMAISDGAVIGCGAVVTKPIPSYAIAVGVPAKIIGYRFDDETIEKLLRLCWWDFPKEKVVEYWPVLREEPAAEKLDAILRAEGL